MPFHRNTRFALVLCLALSPIALLAAQPAVTQTAFAMSVDAVAQPSVLLTTDQGLPAVWLAEPLRVASRPVTPLAPETTATVDGSIGAAEYGAHVDGQNQQTNGGTTAYMTWDATNLYVAYAGANTAEGVVVYLDLNPVVPANGATNAYGNLTGRNYDGARVSGLPFRADVVAYFKNGYREYRTADGSGGWSGATTGFGSYADNGANTRELAIPWSALGGQPARFNFFAYATSSAGFVYGQVPAANGDADADQHADGNAHVNANGNVNVNANGNADEHADPNQYPHCDARAPSDGVGPGQAPGAPDTPVCRCGYCHRRVGRV